VNLNLVLLRALSHDTSRGGIQVRFDCAILQNVPQLVKINY